MYLIVTRSFPPELGGMQSLMWGLARELSKNFMIKVFADYVEKHKEFDEQATFSIERVGGPKLLRKYRKAFRYFLSNLGPPTLSIENVACSSNSLCFST